MFEPRIISGVALAFTLAACQSGGAATSANPAPPLDFTGFGVAAGTSGSNGVAFAEGADSHLTLDTTPMTMKVIRIERDPVTRALEVFLTEETITLEEDFMTRAFRDATFTLGDTFWDTDNPPAGVAVRLYKDIVDRNIGEIRVADDTGGVDEIFHQGFIVFGRETDPLHMPTGSEDITYNGRFVLQGYPSQDGGLESELVANMPGEMTLVLALDTQTISGDFEVGYNWVSPIDPPLLSGIVSDAPVVGNGFTAGLLVTGCTDGLTCSGEGQIGGVFYDSDAGNLSGLAFLALEVADVPKNPSGTEDHSVQAIGHFSLEADTSP